ncbi:hypothetical protein L1987_13835 [Smallanthus sonchifolius]|uniref:Uncharacterized protein n=1 Tax=Smallanthus sonchifolius TaxID=185202 RepID=A0ACB9JKB4_9ASTR|nr:hypothetical protein L1987_13835 [Smallanthus sonchifolius]
MLGTVSSSLVSGQERRESWRMFDQQAKGVEFEKKADKKLSGCGFLGYDYGYAAHLYEKAANCYKVAQSWDQAGAMLCSKRKAAEAYANAEHIACLEQALNLFMEIGTSSVYLYAIHCKEIGELYEQEQNLEQAITYYDKAADYFEYEEATISANQCKQKIAQFSAQLGEYQNAINIYEELARQSLKDKLTCGVREHLFNAGICHLCKGNVLKITNALERYQELYPAFSRTRKYRLLADLAVALDEEDVVKFTDAAKKFDSITKLDVWKKTLLLSLKLMFKAKEGEEHNLN